jgi:hypothetical protein
MRNIKTFESYSTNGMELDLPIKEYGKPFKLTDLTPGDKITYAGEKYEVLDSNEYFTQIRSEKTGNTTNLNQNMFNQKVFISKEDIPLKLK